MDVKEKCPICGQRLFMEKLDGSRVCANCGHLMSGGAADTKFASSKSSKPANEPTGVSCPQCGSQMKLVRHDTDGTSLYECPICGHSVRNKPAAAPSSPATPTTDKKGLDGREIFNIAKSNTVEVVCQNGKMLSLGSGFIFADHYIMTNAHVVFDGYGRVENPQPSKMITVNYKNGKPMNASFVCGLLIEDMAILRIEEPTPNIAKIAKNMPETGEALFVVGNSNGEGMCILEGIVSDQLRERYGLPYMMLSAIAVHGNSGGPVFDTRGEVVGILTQGHADSVAMNYAIPIPRIRAFLETASRELKINFRLK